MWEFCETEGKLTRGDVVAQLTPKASAVLSCLMGSPGQIVSQQDILAYVWGDVHVSPDLVREYIFDIRTALGDDASNPKYIKTVRGRGFRLIGDITRSSKTEDRGGNPRIAVLRPEVFGPKEQWRHIADALGEDLTTDLARFADLDVIARQSSYAADPNADIQQIARTLAADYVIESSLAIGEDDVRCTFQLIAAVDGTHIFADRKIIPRTDLPQLCEDIAALTANAVGSWSGATLEAERARLRRRAMSSYTAYEHYLLAAHYEHYFDAESVRLAIEHGERATQLDPHHARSWLALSFVYRRAHSALNWDFQRCRALSNEAIDRAHNLDRRDPLILCEMAFSAVEMDRAGTVPDLLARAADLGRNQADACALLANARVALVYDPDAAKISLEAALKLSPFPPVWYRLVASRVAFFGQDYTKAIAESQAIQDEVPQAMIFGALATAMLEDKRATREARDVLDRKLPGVSLEDHARNFPIVAPEALELFDAACARLRAA